VTEQAYGAARSLLCRAGLPQAWASQPVWRILDTHFDLARFLATWQTWQADAQRPRVLHVVALSAQPPAASLLQAAASSPELQPLAQELAGQWRGLLPGFHRLLLAQGQLALTLCVGELQPLLREQQFQADTILLDSTAPWDRWSAKALARCCRRGTALACETPSPALTELLGQTGFDVQGERVQFAPRWELKTNRETLRTEAAAPTTCAVIGAGLAGASIAAALARRGWQVQVFDAAPVPASGASGLPAGLVVPHVSSDDSPRSRLSRAGVRLMLQEAQRVLPEGQDWAPSGVLEQRLDGRAGLPEHWPAEGRDISRPAPPFDAAPWHEGTAVVPALWHAQAAWIKPARLVQAWLARPGVQFCGDAKVAALRKASAPSDTTWHLLDRDGRTLGTADQVVLANASDAPRHRMNLEKLRTLLPAAARALAPAFEPGAAHGWGGTRCVSADRLPLVGPLEDGPRPSLWISAAMGSRGLSFSLLCAELLAARLGAEPWPVEASLARFLHARRRPTMAEEDL